MGLYEGEDLTVIDCLQGWGLCVLDCIGLSIGGGGVGVGSGALGDISH